MRARERMGLLASRFPIPTTRTMLLFVLGLAIATAWGWKGALVTDMALLLLCTVDYATLGKEGVMSGSRLCPQRFSQGVEHVVKIHLWNKGSAERFVQARDQTPMRWEAAPVCEGVVPGRGRTAFQYRIIPPERGKYVYGDIWTRTLGPLGLVRKPEVIPGSQEIQVYPRLQTLQCADLGTYRRVARHWGLRPSWKSREGREFESLRDYVEGDDPRRIHWKATARFDRPIVQDFQAERNQIVIILLDAGRLMTAFSDGKSKLDHALEAAAHLAQVAISGGDHVGLVAFSDRVLSFVPPRCSSAQLQSLLREVVDLRPSLVTSRYESAVLWLQSHVRRRSLVVIFTDLLDEMTSEALLAAVGLLRPRHLPLCVAISEAEWGALMHCPPERVRGVYERSVLQALLRQRKKILRSMLHQGALAVDLPPSRLSAGTLEHYLKVKQRGLL